MSDDLRGRAQSILRRFAARLIDDAASGSVSPERLTETVLALVEKAQALDDNDTAARLLVHFGPQMQRESHLERLDACHAAVLTHEGLSDDRYVNLSGRRVQILTALGRRAEAEAVLAAAWPRADSPLLRAQLYNRQGYLLASYEDYAAARQVYEQGLIEAKTAGARPLVGIIYNNLGEMAFTAESYDEACSNFAQALDAIQSLPEASLRGMIEGGMAMTLDALARFDEANEHHEAARRGYQEAGDDFGLNRIDLNQAYNAVMRGDFSRAIELASRALSQARIAGNSHHFAMAHQHLGEAYLETAQYELAWESFSQALAMRLDLGIPLYIATTVQAMQRLIDALAGSTAAPAHAALLLRYRLELEAAQVALAAASSSRSDQPPPPPPVPLPLP